MDARFTEAPGRTIRSNPMPEYHDPLQPLRRFRLAAVRFALVLIAVLAVAAWFVSKAAVQGLLLGGLGGLLGFWIIAVRFEKLANMAPGQVKFAALTWTSFRFLLYGVVLYRAYTLDSDHLHGLVSALVGLLVIRFVLIFMGVTGMALTNPEPEDPAAASPSANVTKERHK